MPRTWPFGRGKKPRKDYRRRSPKVLRDAFELREAKRQARLKQEWLTELKERDAELYNQIMVRQFGMSALLEELEGLQGEDGADGTFPLQDSMYGLFVDFLTRKLGENEGDALSKVLEQIDQIEDIRGRVNPRSGDGLTGIALAIADILKGPVGQLLVQGIMAAKMPGGLAQPGGVAPMAIAPPQQGKPVGEQPQEDEMPALPDWIPLDRIVGLLDDRPEDAAMEVLAFAAGEYNQGKGQAIEGIHTLIQIPPAVVRVTLIAYEEDARYATYVERILANGTWLEEFLGVLKDKFGALERGDNIWETTSAPTVSEAAATQAPAR